ncbi:MAG: hypothetical protein ABIZ72_03445 [Candidatus Limnocylindrales bacterium]
MHIDRRLVGFGLFLITVGGVKVAVRQGLLSEPIARQAWTLWPLIIVAVGLSIVLAGRPGAAIGGLVLAITFGAMVGGVAASGVFPGAGLCSGNDDEGATFSDGGGDLGSSARVTITQDCGDLALGTVSGSTWSLSGRSRDGRAPEITRTSDTLRISTRDEGPFDVGGSGNWSLVLPRDAALRLDVKVNGGQSRFVFDGAHLGSVEVEANAGSLDVDLREAAAVGDTAIDVNFGSATLRLPRVGTTIRLSVNAGSAVLCLPEGTGLRVRLESVAASNDLAAHGLVETRGMWQTPGYDEASARIDVHADVNAGSLSLDPVRTCVG